MYEKAKQRKEAESALPKELQPFRGLKSVKGEATSAKLPSSPGRQIPVYLCDR